MKKALSFLLVLSMLLGMAVLAPIGAAAEDEATVGTVAADYKPEGTAVATAEEFAAMKEDGQYYLSADITLSASYAGEFKGTLDGAGHTVTISAPVFKTFSGTVKNLVIEAVGGTISGGDGEDSYGALACLTNGMTAVNVLNKAAVYSGANTVAGFVGRALGAATFENCTNDGAVTTTVGMPAGFVAYAHNVNLKFVDCANNGDVRNPVATTVVNVETKNLDIAAGGFVAMNGNWSSNDLTVKSVFENCVNKGEVVGYAQVGGLAGCIMMNATFTKCANYGKVYGSQQTANLALDDSNTKHMGAYCAGIIARGGNDTSWANGDKVGITVTDCTNYGDIISDRDQAGGIGSYMNTSFYATGCVNNGLVMLDMGTNTFGDAAGILASFAGKASMKTICVITSCVNNGTIISNKRAAGILGTAGGASHNAVNGFRVTKCANTGDVYSFGYGLDASGALKSSGNSCIAAGIIAYVYGSVGATRQYNQYAYIEYCTNTGNLYSARFCGPWIGYTNELNTVVRYCVFGGTLNPLGYVADYKADLTLRADMPTSPDASITPIFALMGCSSAKYKLYTTYDSDDNPTTLSKTILDSGNVSVAIPEKLLLADNYVLDTCGLEWFTWAADDSNKSNRIPIAVAIASGVITVVTEGQFTSGALTVMLNDKIGELVFFQNLNDNIFTEVDKCPTTDATHAKVMYSASEGKYVNLLFDINPDITPATGDATVYVVIALGVSAVALAGLVIAKKKKVRD